MKKKIVSIAFKVYVLGKLGLTYGFLGEYDRALEFHDRSLDFARRSGDIILEAEALLNLGITYNFLGEYKQASKLCSKSIDIGIKTGDAGLEINGYLYLDYFLIFQGQYKWGTQLLRQSLDRARDMDDVAMEACALDNLGLAHLKREEYKQAIEYYDRAFTIRQQIINTPEMKNFLKCFDRVCTKLKNNKESIEYCKEYMEIAIQIGDRQLKTEISIELDLAYTYFAKHVQIVESLQEILFLTNNINEIQLKEEVDKLVSFVRA